MANRTPRKPGTTSALVGEEKPASGGRIMCPVDGVCPVHETIMHLRDLADEATNKRFGMIEDRMNKFGEELVAMSASVAHAADTSAAVLRRMDRAEKWRLAAIGWAVAMIVAMMGGLWAVHVTPGAPSILAVATRERQEAIMTELHQIHTEIKGKEDTPMNGGRP